MKKVLYIYGYGSDENSSTAKSLQNVLGYDYKVSTVYYGQLQPNEAIEYLSNYICENGIDAVIGSSLGGFYALQLLSDETSTVVINPCMKPSVELPKIGCPAEIAERFKRYENYYENYNEKKNVYGLFGTDDELIDYHNLFEKSFGKNSFSFFKSQHRPTESQLRNVEELIKEHI